MAALSWGVEALMLGSLTMLASGVFARAPSSARSSATRWSSGSRSAKLARIRAPSEMSRVSTDTSAVAAYASMMGRNEYVANSGASSVWV
jgi:hypothetical protein